MWNTVLILLHSVAGLVCFTAVAFFPLREIASWRLRLYTGSLITMFELVIVAIAVHWIASALLRD
jgi:hypothetical protein